MVSVPALIPFTMPEPAPTVAIEVWLLVHVPPAVTSLNVMLDPVHTAPVPGTVIGVGAA